MYLINVATFELVYFVDESRVPGGYAILSHRWEEEEVLYKDITKAKRRARMRDLQGWYKIEGTCQQASIDGLQYAWVDICCINKESSPELQEAINSMFRWYANATVCYAYLSDVESEERLVQSKWFTRGWTLQELLAPKMIIFFDMEWVAIRSRRYHAAAIAEATGITQELLTSGWTNLDERPCAAVIFVWASKRLTARIEDASYCLLGLFDLNMPLLYGEGHKAFIRLQHEILRSTDDQSLFAWKLSAERTETFPFSGPLATSLRMFKLPDNVPVERFLELESRPRCQPHWIDSEGITVDAYLHCIAPRLYLAFLSVPLRNANTSSHVWDASLAQQVGILLSRVDADNRYVRCQQPELVQRYRQQLEGGICVEKVGHLGAQAYAKRQVIKILAHVRSFEANRIRHFDPVKVILDVSKLHPYPLCAPQSNISVHGNAHVIASSQDTRHARSRTHTRRSAATLLFKYHAASPRYPGPPPGGARLVGIGIDFDCHFRPFVVLLADMYINWDEGGLSDDDLRGMLYVELLEAGIQQKEEHAEPPPPLLVMGERVTFQASLGNPCLVIKTTMAGADRGRASANVSFDGVQYLHVLFQRENSDSQFRVTIQPEGLLSSAGIPDQRS